MNGLIGALAGLHVLFYSLGSYINRQTVDNLSIYDLYLV